ncbi:MAG: hypothetical protein AB1942_21690 [Pseudomonadota bacterium]
MLRATFLAIAISLAAAGAHADTYPVRVAPKIVQFWRTHPATVLTGDPSKDARGTVYRTLGPPHISPRAAATPAEVALFKRRLQVVLDALLAQPSLQDPRGLSVVAGANISRISVDEGVGSLIAEVNLLGRPILLDDPKTTRAKDGRYFTPGEGVVLRVGLNAAGFLQEKWPTVRPDGRTITPLGSGAHTSFVISSVPVPPDSTARSLVARWEKDRSWTGGPGEASMVVYTSSYRQENDRLEAGQLPPTDPAARFAAAVAMVDWSALRARLLEIR